MLDELLEAREYPDDRNGILRDTLGPVRRIGLALEPSGATGEVLQLRAIDALFLHRPWGLELEEVPAEIGVLAYHLPFDEHLTLGYSPRLARALQLEDPEPLGFKQGRAIGMIGDVSPTPFSALRSRLEGEFGGLEEVVPPLEAAVRRIAIVGAMDDALVREAAARGAGAYLTGQLRAPARRAVEETRIGILATGHRRAEEWGLRALAALLRERWPALEVLVVRDREPGRC